MRVFLEITPTRASLVNIATKDDGTEKVEEFSIHSLSLILLQFDKFTEERMIIEKYMPSKAIFYPPMMEYDQSHSNCCTSPTKLRKNGYNFLFDRYTMQTLIVIREVERIVDL